MSIANMKNYSGRNVVNQFVVTSKEGKMFQSYSTDIAFVPNDGSPIRLNVEWRSTSTTAKYRNQFLNTTTKQIEHGLRNGDYIIDESM